MALSITLDGVRKQVHIDRCALVDEDPYERDTVLDEITLFRRRPEEMERRIVHEAQSGWSGPPSRLYGSGTVERLASGETFPISCSPLRPPEDQGGALAELRQCRPFNG